MTNADLYLYIHLNDQQQDQMEEDFKNYGNIFIRIIHYGDESYRVVLLDPNDIKDKIYEEKR